MARIGKKKKKVWKKPKASAEAPASSSSAARVWQPGVDQIGEDEELQYDRNAYDCLHAFHLGWPCLSFDIVRDTLGALRHEFPHTVYCVAGTQADTLKNNHIAVVKLSNITGKKRSPQPARRRSEGSDDESDSESESESESDEDEQEASESKPTILERLIPHQGCVNRIRAMQQQPHIVASWSDTGCVQVWDVSAQLNALAANDTNSTRRSPHPPLQIFKGHKDEGFALDWSPSVVGRLATGDCKSAIHVWEPANGKWNVDSVPFLGHSASVEDLQWSPTEGDVFASCSVDKTIGIWDTRTRRREISVKAHDSDVNVISWNRSVGAMLASGSDDGTFRIWDLRVFKEDSFVAHFKHHSSYITSIEWSPHEASTLALSSADNQLSIWDLSLERDAEEEAQYQMELGQEQAKAPENLPPQLLFVHQGQKDMKELHYHPQIHGMILSTAGDGFNVFKPSNT